MSQFSVLLRLTLMIMMLQRTNQNLEDEIFNQSNGLFTYSRQKLTCKQVNNIQFIGHTNSQ